MKNQSQKYYTPIQLKMPVEMERMIEADDPVYSFNEVKKLCKTDIRFLWLLDGEEAPSHMTIANFINEEINRYIFEKGAVDLQHIYMDGTKITANANRYSWVWKKSCETSRKKVFVKVSEVLEAMNGSGIELQGVKFGTRASQEHGPAAV